LPIADPREDPAMTVSPGRRRASLPAILAALVGVGLAAVAIGRLGLHHVVHSLVGVHFGWLALAAALMVLSLLVRAVSWLVVLRAALPGEAVPAPLVVRATMIGVMVSAVFPGRLGEAARAIVVARRVGSIAVVAGTILSQTMLNLVALVALGAAVITSTGAFSAPVGALLSLSAPLALVGLMLILPGALRRAGEHGPPRVRRALARVALELERVRGGLRVFRHLRDGVAATVAQLTAWALQVLSAYFVLEALQLQRTAGLAGAAAVLVAVNVTAVVPVTPSNVGVFQAACVAVLAGFGVSGGHALAYGIVLQAVEVLTAVGLGLPALAAEGMSWSQVRRSSEAIAE
jgi:phosphatidylinositol alpha-mannosyltransferase